MPLTLLAALFLLIAVAYASVGFGGGSSYNALLIVSGMDYRAVPAIALTCNILVVSGGVYHFRKSGLLAFRELLPFVVLSVPMAWYGGKIEVSESTFVGLLGSVLLATGLQMLWKTWRQAEDHAKLNINTWMLGLPLGAAIGLLSGIVGVGGGIFLAPVLYLTGWGRPRRIAAMASGFILVNSIAGLSGHLLKQGSYAPYTDWLAAWPMFLAVIAGGQIGSRLGNHVLPEKWVRGLTGVLILYVAVRLLLKWFSIR